MSSATVKSIVENRLRGALWGMFAGDALAAPTHWYYGGFSQIQSDYGSSGITTYTKPVKSLAGSILNKSDPNGGGRRSVGGGEFEGDEIFIIGDIINHGKLKFWDPNESYHYHATLQAGENTLEMQLARVLMKSIVDTNGIFQEENFRNAYIQFMTTKGSHNDVYASTCHRMFFANLTFQKKDPKDCPDNDGHNVDTIDGLILPTITALAAIAKKDVTIHDIQSAAARTAAVTRSSALLEKYSEVWAGLLYAAINSKDGRISEPLENAARALGMNSPRSDRKIDQMSACYLSQSLPPTFDVLSKYTQQGNNTWNALLANANIGGENVHRGAVLGAVLGACQGYEGMQEGPMIEGLYARKELENEINNFVNAVMGSQSE